MGHKGRHRKTRRQRAEDNRPLAEKNKEERAKRTPEEQLKLLDLRLGIGKGAKKERTKLLKQIADRGRKEDV